MSCTRDQYIFSAEQIEVPNDFPGILKNFTKTVVKENPSMEELVGFSRQYFEKILDSRGYFDEQRKREEEERAAQDNKMKMKPKDFITNFTDSMMNYYIIKDVVEKGKLNLKLFKAMY
jgi:hypothetical protein